MTFRLSVIALALAFALAACGSEKGAEGERKTAAGEVLGGSISDAMLPLDTVTSKGPPLREASDAKGGGKPAAKASAANDDDDADAPAEPAAEESASEG